jgi:hypothetical protein
MDTARVAILLVSANSLTSDFILRDEIEHLLKRRKEEGMIIMPLIVEPCDWQAITWLREMAVRPKDGRPLSGGNKHQINTHLTDFAKEIRRLLNHSDGEVVAPLSLVDRPDVSALESSVAVSTDRAAVEITLNRDIESYSEADQRQFLDAVARFLQVSGDVRVINKRKGSVKLTLELRPEDAERLMWAIKQGEFGLYDAVDAVIVESHDAVERSWEPSDESSASLDSHGGVIT